MNYWICDILLQKAYRYAQTAWNTSNDRSISELECNIQNAIKQEKFINQDVHNVKGNVSSNIGAIIEMIINDDGK